VTLAGRLVATLNRVPIGERGVRVGGDRLFVASLDRWVAALAWKLGLLEAAERRLIRRQVRPGAVAVDVGANVGLHTLALARAVGADGRVHALEPAPENHRLLARAVRDARLSQVHVHQAAAAACAGEALLYLAAANRGDHRLHPGVTARTALRVRTVVLDELLAAEPRVDFVKIDVQGAELAVVDGLHATLARSAGAGVLCELCPVLLRAAGSEPAALLARFARHGLRPHRLGRDGGVAAIPAAAALAAAERAGWLNLWFASADTPAP
jgi:FkbM family methyltransferase